MVGILTMLLLLLQSVQVMAGAVTLEHRWPNLFPLLPEVLGFESKFVEVEPGVKLHVIDRPGLDPDLPPAVFIHGFPNDWHSWQRLFPLLGAERRLMAMDLRGYGASSKPLDKNHTLELFANDVHQVLLKLGIREVGVLVGQSMGSFVAWYFAGSWPEMVKQLVLMSTKAADYDAGPGSEWGSLSINDITENDYEVSQVTLFSTIKDFSGMDVWFTESQIHASMQVPLEVWALLALPKTRALADRLLPKISAPTTLIRGELDGLMTAENQVEMLGLLKNGTLHTVPGVGHSIQWEPKGAAATARLLIPLLRAP